MFRRIGFAKIGVSLKEAAGEKLLGRFVSQQRSAKRKRARFDAWVEYVSAILVSKAN